MADHLIICMFSATDCNALLLISARPDQFTVSGFCVEDCNALPLMSRQQGLMILLFVRYLLQTIMLCI